MKRIAFTLLALIMLFTAVFPCAAFAEVPDFSEMSTEEILEILNAIRNELKGRELVQHENIMLLDQNDVQVYLTGNYEVENYGSSGVYLELEAIVINNTDTNIGVSAENVSINGWVVDFTGIGDIAAGKKKKGDIELRISDADISTFEEVEDLELSMLVYSQDTWERIFIAEPLTVYLNEMSDSFEAEEPASSSPVVSEAEFNEIRYITFQPGMLGDEITQESLDAEAGDDYISAVLNEDGTVTYEMNGQQYVNFLWTVIESLKQLEWTGIEVDESAG